MAGALVWMERMNAYRRDKNEILSARKWQRLNNRRRPQREALHGSRSEDTPPGTACESIEIDAWTAILRLVKLSN
jgi:hypothetical protein